MKTFYWLLVNSVIAGVTTNFVWFGLTFWIYLETESVLATSYLAGIYLVATAASGFWFGAIVDHNKKKTAMLISSVTSLVAFLIGYIFFQVSPNDTFIAVNNPQLWILVVILMSGVVAGNIRSIALPTTVTILVDEAERDKANGLSGGVMGIIFSITSFASGFALAYGGLSFVLILAIVFTGISLLHLFLMSIPEKKIVHLENQPKRVDIKGTYKLVQSIPGLLGLILFATINNFLGGVFMALMDAYGLSLVSVQVWGTLFGFLSLGFIFGGVLINRFGLGANPLKTLLFANVAMWVSSIFFTIQPSIFLMAGGILVWITLVPFIEAAEQTVIQKVVPQERQGRVFGFSQSVEQLASPLAAFLIGPVAQLYFIPFMTAGAGVDLIGNWYGVGQGRGIALVFSFAGLVGLFVTASAFRSRAYRLLSNKYLEGGKDTLT